LTKFQSASFKPLPKQLHTGVISRLCIRWTNECRYDITATVDVALESAVSFPTSPREPAKEI